MAEKKREPMKEVGVRGWIRDERRNRKISYFISERANKNSNKKIKKEEKKEINARALEIIGDGLVAISNESRRKILQYIIENKEVTFEDLRSNFNMNNNTLTFHLQKLLDAYIISQPKGRRPYQVGALGDIMLQLLDTYEEDASSILERILA